MKIHTGQAIVITAILTALTATFYAANSITGFATYGQVEGAAKSAGAIVIGLGSILGLVAIARIGNAQIEAAKAPQTAITQIISKAEEHLGRGKIEMAKDAYFAIRQEFERLQPHEKGQHYSRILQIHGAISKEALRAEAAKLTEKYANNTITKEEFKRLEQIMASQPPF